jgi:hypothetical protein
VRVKNCPTDAEHAPTQQTITRITVKTLPEWSGGIWFTSHWEKKFAGLLVSSAPTPLMWGFFVSILGLFTSTNDTHS